MPKPPKVLHLDEVEAVAGPGTLSWLPIRHSLGIRAFGCNAYVADEAGKDVVEPHTEDSALAHEELYVVLRGQATFTIDGESYTARTGTYVFVPDPASHRRAVADEPGTTVLSFGGPPTFQPSAWEWGFRAAAMQQTDPERAREVLEEGLGVHPESGMLRYGMACAQALEGKTEEALSSLRESIELEPSAREWARDDSDFDRLRADKRFMSLVGT